MKNLKYHSGGIVAELAISLPIFLTLLYVSFEVLWVMNVKQTMLFAARESARTYVVSSDEKAAQDIAAGYLKASNLEAPSLSFELIPPGFDQNYPRLFAVKIEMKLTEALLMGPGFERLKDEKLTIMTYMVK